MDVGHFYYTGFDDTWAVCHPAFKKIDLLFLSLDYRPGQ